MIASVENYAKESIRCKFGVQKIGRSSTGIFFHLYIKNATACTFTKYFNFLPSPTIILGMHHRSSFLKHLTYSCKLFNHYDADIKPTQMLLYVLSKLKKGK